MTPNHSSKARVDNRQSALSRYCLSLWYGHASSASWWLPLSYVYRLLAFCRAYWQRSQATPYAVPVIVVGNLTVGGTGKTPTVIALAKQLRATGLCVGIVSRGYGSQSAHFPVDVTANTPSHIAGDEALLLAKESCCPLIIHPKRSVAAAYLLAHHPEVQLIISDDGLQHYALHRDMEILVIDSTRGVGNGYCLPAGPLREPVSRLNSVDWLVINGGKTPVPFAAEVPQTTISLQPCAWQHVASGETLPLKPFPWGDSADLTAVAGIGHPQRFFTSLTQLGLVYRPVSFDDHHPFTTDDFQGINGPVLMTAKDAVKCAAFAQPNWWALRVEATLDERLLAAVLAKHKVHH
ncbi:MAG: tetraacyldisaccharide 4'-kinase [Cellvibrionaceae bacterium]|nr:tetraacyldisaccharide 4'-kinase [Cellvibrionaceae bacterium]